MVPQQRDQAICGGYGMRLSDRSELAGLGGPRPIHRPSNRLIYKGFIEIETKLAGIISAKVSGAGVVLNVAQSSVCGPK